MCCILLDPTCRQSMDWQSCANGVQSPRESMLTPQTSITQLPLIKRDKNALEYLGAATIADFLAADLEQVCLLPRFGATTYSRLKRARNRLQDLMFFNGSADSKYCDTSEDGIRGLRLSSRELRTLRRLQVKTVHDFLLLDLTNTRRRLPGCGLVTFNRLTRTQADLRRKWGYEPPIAPTDQMAADNDQNTYESAIVFVSQPPTLGSWRRLPLFSETAMSGVCAEHLHESYQPNVPVQRLLPSRHAQRAFALSQIVFLGELLLTPGPQVIRGRGLGVGTLATIRSLVGDFLRDSLSGIGEPIDVSSPEAYLQSLIYPVIKDDRQRRVLLARMDGQGKPRVLEDVAHEFCVTREGIRQIERKALRKLWYWPQSEALKLLHHRIQAMLQNLAPVLTLESIVEGLRVFFGWDYTLSPHAVTKLLPAFSDLKLVDKRFVCRQELPGAEGAGWSPLLEMKVPAAVSVNY